MIQIKDKSKCCGCEACVQVCSKQCIDFKQDSEGFYYPQINSELCIQCGLCEKVCPELTPYKESKPLEVIAAINKDEKIRLESSSGGIFTLLAEKFIHSGGVVFGVRFDENWHAVFDYAETIDKLAAFRGSKYLQARIGNSYAQCKKMLDEGRQVLFSGTQCQISGLNHYLRKSYPNLLTVDIICHGVPSPKVWQKYLEEVKTMALKNRSICLFFLKRLYLGRNLFKNEIDKRLKIEHIAFRDKRFGWKNFSIAITISDIMEKDRMKTISFSNRFYEDSFMKAFLANLIIRPSCYSCPAKGGRSHADMTIADFWGIEKVNSCMDDDNGTSVVVFYTEKARWALDMDTVKYVKATYQDVLSYNSSLVKSVLRHPNREIFFAKFDNNVDLIRLINHSLRPALYQRLKHLFKRAVCQVK